LKEGAVDDKINKNAAKPHSFRVLYAFLCNTNGRRKGLIFQTRSGRKDKENGTEGSSGQRSGAGI
jgi:hypothetical protein